MKGLIVLDKKDEVILNEFHCNSKIKGKLLKPEDMKKLGFRELDDRWFYTKMLKDEISFDLSIYKDNPTDRVNIEIFDDDFGQYYDYQRILEECPNHDYANQIKDLVEKQMSYFISLGVLNGHKYGEYI